MNALKAKAKISCDTCGCTMNRTKTIRVEASVKEDAIKEASEKITKWKNSLKGKSCAVCASILKSMK
ncbi:hypothetical protein Psm1vBMR14_gp35c [Pseudomonas phage MR14]|nr:hypothetical protein Psm1vBMR14_gp35c [Pseudomonas phage MR14]